MKVRRAVTTALAACLSAVAVVSATGAQRAAGTNAVAAAAPTPIYQDPSYSFAERAADLVSRMSTAEKASQTISSVAPAIPRLGIQQYGWWNEALHGVSRLQYNNNANASTLQNTTSYPIDQSLGASWDPSLVYKVATAISDEAREVVPGNTLNLDFYSPTMNLERDPRWGRNDESYAEDPLLVTKLVDEFVNGMEGKATDGKLLPDGNGYKKLLTTIKHYAANNSETNRRTGSSDMDDRTLREYYTKAFRGIVQDADPASVMSSYNRVNGTPAAADPYLIDTLMRETFGFTGYMTSDCDAIFEIVAGHRWQPPDWTRPANNIERHALAMSAGEDSNCQVGFHDFYSNLNSVPEAAGESIKTPLDTFNVNDLDNTVERLFTARMSTGEFDDVANQPWVQQARARVPQGTWVNSNTNNAVTETADRLALAREAGDKTIVLLKNKNDLLPLHVPSSGAYKVAVIGYFSNPSAASIYLGGYSSAQGTAGQAKIVNGYNGLKSAIQALDPDATVDYYKGFTGTGTTAATLTAVDPAAVAAAAGYDAVIVYVGTDNTTATEDRDRATIVLPGAQGSLISQVAAANPHTAVYMETIGPIDVSAWEPSVGSILWSSYNGQRKGESLADVVLGRYDPSGRLPSTWYANDAQMPAITDYDIRGSDTKPGRTYQYFKGAAAYPFGFGLSYTSFDYSNLQIDKKTLTPDDSFTVSADVKNSGTAAGTETVQLYVSEPDAPANAQRPAKRLEGFQKVTLDPGQTKTVSLTVKVADLAFSDGGKWVVDPERYGIQLSRSAADSDIAPQDTVNVSGTLTAVPSVVTVKALAAGDAARDIQQRVLFPENTAIVPHLTVAMNDDTLYGYIRKGQSKALPNGLGVTYSSNRPSVVAVDSGGTLRTVGNGVATVTATVSYHGVTKTAQFVVRVVSYLSSLTVDGKPVAGFAPDRLSYDVTLPMSYSGVPTVAAAAVDPAATVSVTQAAALPGSAKVTVTGTDGNTYTYTVNFAQYGANDEFDGNSLGPQWTVVRPNPATLSVGGGALSIKPEAGDLLLATNTAKNLVLQNAPGNFTAEAKLDFSVVPHAATQGGGIIAYQDDDNWLWLACEFAGNVVRISETLENGAFQAIPGQSPQPLLTIPTASLVTGKTIYFRLVRRGVRYASYYSTDGSTWNPIYETGAALSNAKVGPYAYNGTGTSSDLTVDVDYFHVDTAAPTTTAAVSPTPDANGGVNGPATVTLSASDDDSGVASTEYRVDGGGWQTYTGPFVISNGGGRVLQYRSTDNIGNVEATHTLDLIINPQATGQVGGSVPATLALTLGPAAWFGAFTPGVAKDYTAQTSATVICTAGDAALSVSDPGHLTNGAFSLPSPLQVSGVPRTWSAPVSNDQFTIGFTQHIGATDALRTGSYSKTLTFTLSTTTP